MASPKTAVSPAAQTLEAPKFRLVDGVMILLALVSVTLVFLDIFARARLYDWGIFREVIVADLVITLVFLGDFVLENRGKAPGRILRDSWFDIVGLVPMIAFVWFEARSGGIPFGAVFNEQVRLVGGAAASGGLLRLFRFVRVVRIVQAFSRFLRATNMTLGEQVTKRLFDKYRRIIVAELTTPIMVAGISVTQEIVVRMKFLEAAGKSLDAKRPEIHAAVLEALRKNKIPESVITQPLVDRIVNDVEKAVVDAVVTTLTGPEINKLVQEMVVEVMENFKVQLQSPEGKALLRSMGDAPP
ncbi:MAG TPA: ion transporter [Candidatus Thermoplasmatota archaeon]|nr:ion transporter [Candidatus Thermoplasmatota archaeon]